MSERVKIFKEYKEKLDILVKGVDALAKKYDKTVTHIPKWLEKEFDENSQHIPLSLDGVKYLINLYNNDKKIKVDILEAKKFEELQAILDGSIEDRKSKKRIANLSFKIILENSKPIYHFIMLVNCYDCIYIFDPIGIEGNDWGKKIKRLIEANKTKYPNIFMNTTELQKDYGTCGDYVVEFFRILITLYDNCKRNIKLFNDHLSSFFDKETEIEKKINLDDLKINLDDFFDKETKLKKEIKAKGVPILPKEFLELNQSSSFLKVYVAVVGKIKEELEILNKESKTLDEEIERLNKKLIIMGKNSENTMKSIVERLENLKSIEEIDSKLKIFILFHTDKITKEQFKQFKETSSENIIEDKKIEEIDIIKVKEKLRAELEMKEKLRAELISKIENKKKYIVETLDIETIISTKKTYNVTKILEKRLEHFMDLEKYLDLQIRKDNEISK